MTYGFRRNGVYYYDRIKAAEYAHKWALGRNPNYFDFEKYGGDCTNFASQVIYAGSGEMNYTPNQGWYYTDSYNRSPAWTDVDYLFNFLTTNKGRGPVGEQVDIKDLKVGDIVQLSFKGAPDYNHSPVVVWIGNPVSPKNILIAAHTYDRDYYPLANYNWVDIRFIHVLGVKNYK